MSQTYCHSCGGIISGGFCSNSGCMSSPNWTLQNSGKSPWESSKKKRQIQKQKKIKRSKTKPHPNDSDNQWRIVFFIAGAIDSAFFMSEAGVNDSAAYVIGGLLGGLFCASIYKILIAIIIGAITIGVLSNL